MGKDKIQRWALNQETLLKGKRRRPKENDPTVWIESYPPSNGQVKTYSTQFKIDLEQEVKIEVRRIGRALDGGKADFLFPSRRKGSYDLEVIVKSDRMVEKCSQHQGKGSVQRLVETYENASNGINRPAFLIGRLKAKD